MSRKWGAMAAAGLVVMATLGFAGQPAASVDSPASDKDGSVAAQRNKKINELGELMEKLLKQIEDERLEERSLGQKLRVTYEPITNYYPIIAARDEDGAKLVARLEELEAELAKVRAELNAKVEALREYRARDDERRAAWERIRSIVEHRPKLIEQRNAISREYFKLRQEAGTLPAASPTANATPAAGTAGRQPAAVASAGSVSGGTTNAPCVPCDAAKHARESLRK